MNEKQATLIKMMTVEELRKRNTQLKTYFLNVQMYMCEGSNEAALSLIEKNGAKAEWELVKSTLREKKQREQQQATQATPETHGAVESGRGIKSDHAKPRVSRRQAIRRKRA